MIGQSRPNDDDPVDLDMVIIGAGLSGIGAACHMTMDRPERTYVILEARADLGGTWDLFRYPGIRSDSDMFTFGYSFRPWAGHRTIADGSDILDYLRDTAAEYGVEERIRYGHKVIGASWDSSTARWDVTAIRAADGAVVYFRCRWLSACAGYYDHDNGHRPSFEGANTFDGTMVTPQFWPTDLDWSGKKIVVIGSGATAITLVPNLARDAEHVTMLQRTPTYIVSVPAVDPFSERITALLSPQLGRKILFWKYVVGNVVSYEFSKKFPAISRWLIRRDTVKRLGPDYPVDVDFAPPYDPWDQRVCVVPDGDLFDCIESGKADIVTDSVGCFEATGVRTESGRLIEADIVVSATGLTMLPIGGIELTVDGEKVDLPDTVVFKGMMLSGVPNFNLVMGYTNNSWTLKADLVSARIAAMLDHLSDREVDYVVPIKPSVSIGSAFVDLKSGYVQRAVEAFPRQGDRTPWRLHQNYLRDLKMFRSELDEETELLFGKRITSISSPLASVPAPSTPRKGHSHA